MRKTGRACLDANLRSSLEGEKRMAPGSGKVARRVFATPEKLGEVERHEKRRGTWEKMYALIEETCETDQDVWELINGLRVYSEFRRNLPNGALVHEPSPPNHVWVGPSHPSRKKAS